MIKKSEHERNDSPIEKKGLGKKRKPKEISHDIIINNESKLMCSLIMRDTLAVKNDFKVCAMNFSECTLNELRCILDQRDLPTKGTKETLIQIVKDYFNESTE